MAEGERLTLAAKSNKIVPVVQTLNIILQKVI